MKIPITVGILLLNVVCWAQIPTVEHVFIVVEENQDFSCVIGNPAMRYLNELATNYGVATSYYATRHPSISNYFVLTTGRDMYEHEWDDLRTDPVDVDNVIRELRRNRKSWRAYVEGVPKSGYTGGDIKSTFYAKRHNPLAYFEKDIPLEERANLAPFPQFASDLKEGGKHLANYSFLVPNLFDDAHYAMGEDGRKLRTATCGDSSALKRADDWPVTTSSLWFKATFSKKQDSS